MSLILYTQALCDFVVEGLLHSLPDEKAIKVRQSHMSILKRCHFQLRGGAKFDALITRLMEYVDNLSKMCSEIQAEVEYLLNGIDSAVV